jgi:hypothetical protein
MLPAGKIHPGLLQPNDPNFTILKKTFADFEVKKQKFLSISAIWASIFQKSTSENLSLNIKSGSQNHKPSENH